MDAIGYVALSRQLALQRQLAVIANNVANATTTGFRAEAMTFQPVRVQAGRGLAVAFVQDLTPRPDLAAGPITMTGAPFDLALVGDGFFAVQTDAGVRYTRGGQFHLDADGQLTTAEGHPVLGEGNQTITLPPGAARVEIGADGSIAVDGAVLGQLQRARFDAPERLRREGAMLFATDEVPGVAEATTVYQGALEGSNVQPILAMTAMIETTRAFEATQKLIETQHDLTRDAVQRQLDLNS